MSSALDMSQIEVSLRYSYGDCRVGGRKCVAVASKND